MMKRCQFKGGAGLKAKFRPALPCLRWFRPKAHASAQKYCEVCRPFAEKAMSRARKNREYAANPEKFRARARKHLPSTYRETDPKKYRTMQDAVNAKQRAWRQTNPQQSAACSARYRGKNPEKAKQSQVKYHKGLHELAALGKKLRTGKPVPMQFQTARRRGRPIEQTTAARITLTACLQIEGLSPGAIRNELFPGYSNIEAQKDAWKKFLKRNGKQIELDNQRLATLSGAERDAIKAESRQLMHRFHRLP